MSWLTSFIFICIAKRPEGRAPEVVRDATDIEVEQGESARIECQITGNPIPHVEWFRDSEKVKETKRIKLKADEETFSLNFKETELDDEGDYKCVARNEFGSVSTQAELLVNEATTKPEFKDKLKNVNVQLGKEARFDVFVTGFPLPEVDWMKEGEKIEDDGCFILLDGQEDGQFSLIINNVKPEHTGKYECIAFNEVGEASCNGNLVVEELLIAPEFAAEAESAPMIGDEGEAIELAVELKKGHPEPEIEWFKGDTPVEIDERVAFAVEENLHSLTIAKATPEDSGSYRFKATSKAGSIERSFNVQIEGIEPNIGITMNLMHFNVKFLPLYLSVLHFKICRLLDIR